MAGVTEFLKALQRYAALAATATIAATAAAEPILPKEPGSRWEYAVRSSAAGEETLVVRIAGFEQIGAKELLKFETVAADVVTKTELIEVDERGVHCHQRAGSDGKATILAPPQTILPWPLKVGVTWQVNDHVAGGGTQEFSVIGEEDVVVPAGTFRAFRLRCEQPWPISTTTERWFAPGKGVVKDVTTIRGPNGRLLSRTIALLRNFSVAIPATDESPPSITIDTASSPQPSAAPAPPQKPGILLEVAGERDGLPRTEYKSDAPQIFVRWSGVNLPVGEAVRVAWIAEDVGDIAPPNFIVDQTETVVETAEFGARFTLSRPKDGWAAGRYRLEVYLGEEMLAKLNVTITD